MKRVLVLLILFTLCFSFLGCKKKPEQPPTTQRQTVKITFPEGHNVLQVAQLLEQNGVCNAGEFMELARETPENFAFAEGIKNSQSRVFALEGYIFPDTYDFYVGESAQNALMRFLKNMSSKITQEDIDRATELGYTIDDIITLASIIQSEAGELAEMKKVSSVFHNRLNSPYNKLESDVTVLYIKEKLASIMPDQETKDQYYKFYNTYSISGLPVGAICNPGRDAITAALYPDMTDYYFFVTDKNDGSYYYARTYEEHRKNCKIAGW